ncbi:LOW QUALITY PROTEIN: doublecortin domain-containing protein 1 [Aegotheles albertisi]
MIRRPLEDHQQDPRKTLELLEECSEKLNLNMAAQVFLADSTEALEPKDIPHDADVYISTGETFLYPFKKIKVKRILVVPFPFPIPIPPPVSAPLLDRCLQNSITPLCGPVWVFKREGFSLSGAKISIQGVLLALHQRLKSVNCCKQVRKLIDELQAAVQSYTGDLSHLLKLAPLLQGVECTSSKFDDDNKLGGALDSLEAYSALQRDLDSSIYQQWFGNNGSIYCKAYPEFILTYLEELNEREEVTQTENRIHHEAWSAAHRDSSSAEEVTVLSQRQVLQKNVSNPNQKQLGPLDAHLMPADPLGETTQLTVALVRKLEEKHPKASAQRTDKPLSIKCLTFYVFMYLFPPKLEQNARIVSDVFVTECQGKKRPVDLRNLA